MRVSSLAFSSLASVVAAQQLQETDLGSVTATVQPGEACNSCCPIVRVTTTVCCGCGLEPTTVYSTVTEPTTIYTTATEIDISTVLRYTTEVEYITEYTTTTQTTTYSTSYPVTVTTVTSCDVPEQTGAQRRGEAAAPTFGANLRNRAQSLCSTVTLTDWETTTATDFITVTQPVTRTQTKVVPTTLTDEETVTAPGPTVTALTILTKPGQTITVPGETIVTTTTETAPAETITVTEDGVTTTMTVPGSIRTATITVTQPPSTITQPGTTVTVTPIFEVSVCPQPGEVTGSFEPLLPSSNSTFGCSPGYVCNPPKPDGCNLWPGVPDDDFVCDPEDCILAPPFYNVTWCEGETDYYPPSFGYFELNPKAFGLSYDIFEFEVYKEVDDGHTTTITIGNWESQTSLTAWPLSTATTTSWVEKHVAEAWARGRRETHELGKRAPSAPSMCYARCGDAQKIAQSLGKDESLCAPDSPFNDACDLCFDCIRDNLPDPDTYQAVVDAYVGPKFQQYLDYCSGANTSPTASSSPGPVSEVATQPTLTTASQGQVSSSDFTPLPVTTTTASSTTKESSSSSPVRSSALSDQVTTPSSTPSTAPTRSPSTSPESSAPQMTPETTPETTKESTTASTTAPGVSTSPSDDSTASEPSAEGQGGSSVRLSSDSTTPVVISSSDTSPTLESSYGRSGSGRSASTTPSLADSTPTGPSATETTPPASGQYPSSSAGSEATPTTASATPPVVQAAGSRTNAGAIMVVPFLSLLAILFP